MARNVDQQIATPPKRYHKHLVTRLKTEVGGESGI